MGHRDRLNRVLPHIGCTRVGVSVHVDDLKRRLRAARLRTAAFARAGCFVVVASTVACHHAGDDDVPPPVASAASVASAAVVPVDQLAPGELIEGPDKAFGLALPRGSVLELNTPDTIIAYCEGAGSAIDAFVKARATGARFLSNPGVLTALSFPSPANKARLIEVNVRRVPHEKASRIEVRDVTPAPKKDLPNDEARFRAIGLDKDGKILDPQHMQ